MYVINEYQTDAAGNTAIVTPATSNDTNEAESIFYTRVAAAAISNVPVHAVTLETAEGFQVKTACYKH